VDEAVRAALACALVSTSLACASAPVAEAPTRVETKDFAMPVPAGFAPSRDDLAPLWAKGGAGLLQRAVIDAENPFRASIGVLPLTPELTALTAEECAILANDVAGRLSSELVEATNTDACRFTTKRRDDATRGTRTVIKIGRTNWNITCNYDTRDAAALAACAEVDAGWQWRP
jgi:hypothetical protein